MYGEMDVFFLNRLDIIYEPLRCRRWIVANKIIYNKVYISKNHYFFLYYFKMVCFFFSLKIIRFGKIYARNPIRAIYKVSGKEVCLMC